MQEHQQAWLKGSEMTTKPLKIDSLLKCFKILDPPIFPHIIPSASCHQSRTELQPTQPLCHISHPGQRRVHVCRESTRKPP